MDQAAITRYIDERFDGVDVVVGSQDAGSPEESAVRAAVVVRREPADAGIVKAKSGLIDREESRVHFSARA